MGHQEYSSTLSRSHKQTTVRSLQQASSAQLTNSNDIMRIRRAQRRAARAVLAPISAGAHCAAWQRQRTPYGDGAATCRLGSTLEYYEWYLLFLRIKGFSIRVPHLTLLSGYTDISVGNTQRNSVTCRRSMCYTCAHLRRLNGTCEQHDSTLCVCSDRQQPMPCSSQRATSMEGATGACGSSGEARTRKRCGLPLPRGVLLPADNSEASLLRRAAEHVASRAALPSAPS
eukprot:2056898-Pleurochrysis_carterae.AAC.1